MLMLGCQDADLVHFHRPGGDKGKGGKEEEEEPPSLAITRVPLHGGPDGIDHGRDWEAHLLPRLYEYVDLIYSLRADTDLRRAWLLAGDERWALLQHRLPYLQGRPAPQSATSGRRHAALRVERAPSLLAGPPQAKRARPSHGGGGGGQDDDREAAPPERPGFSTPPMASSRPSRRSRRSKKDDGHGTAACEKRLTRSAAKAQRAALGVEDSDSLAVVSVEE